MGSSKGQVPVGKYHHLARTCPEMHKAMNRWMYLELNEVRVHFVMAIIMVAQLYIKLDSISSYPIQVTSSSLERMK